MPLTLKKRILFIELGLVIVLAILLLAFEWGVALSDDTMLGSIDEVVMEEEMVITRQQPLEQPPPPPLL